MFVVVHVLAAYQVYINPVFIMCESSLARRTSSGSVNVVVQTLLRMSLVLGITLVAVLIPFFGSLMVRLTFLSTCFLLSAIHMLLVFASAGGPAYTALRIAVPTFNLYKHTHEFQHILCVFKSALVRTVFAVTSLAPHLPACLLAALPYCRVCLAPSALPTGNPD
jgi:hypothetical protein